MPVRKIPPNYLFVTGKSCSKKNGRMIGTEANLEPDFVELLNFDRNVIKFEEQPVRIEYEIRPGVWSRYTPDMLVYYRDLASPNGEKIVLYEIKKRDLIKKEWPAYRPKFKAAYRYARERDWYFKLVTDREIRTSYLDNVKRLNHQIKNVPTPHIKDSILAVVESAPAVTIQHLINSLSQNGLDRAHVLSGIWYLLAAGLLSTNLHIPILMSSYINLTKE